MDHKKTMENTPVVSLNVRIGFWFLDEVRWVKKHNLERKDSQKKKVSNNIYSKEEIRNCKLDSFFKIQCAVAYTHK